MSSLKVEEDQKWVPTNVLVTVLRGRGLRGKGKHGTSDVYTIIQLGKEKYSTGVVEKTTEPEWREECSFELPPGVLESNGGYPAGSRELILTVMHRALIGQDVFLGQAVIQLDKVFQESRCLKNEWYRLNSKTGKKEKERGDIQVTIQFTRNNLTASMYDLVMKDKGASTFSKLKERIKGKRRASDDDSSSAVLPGGYGSLYRLRQRLPSDGGGEEDYEDDEGGEARRSKMRTFFFRGKLRKSSDTRSSTSLGSESSESSSRGGSLSPTAGISVVVSDLSNSPSNSSNLTADNSPEHTANISPKSSSFKCEFDDEAGEITIAVPQRTVCVNGSHSYDVQPLEPGSGKPAGSLGLGPLQKSLPLSVSLQNLSTRAHTDLPKGPAGDGRRWSFDRAGEEEKAAIAAALEKSGPMLGDEEEERLEEATQPKNASLSSAYKAESEIQGKKQRRNLFSHGRSDSAGKGQSQSKDESQHATAAEERNRGWFGSKDSHSKPSLVVSPKLAPSTDPNPPPPPPRHHPSFPLVDSDAVFSILHHSNPFCHSPATPPLISPCNPFLPLVQHNPFYEDVLNAQPLKLSLPPLPYLSSSRPPITQLFPQPSNLNPTLTHDNPTMEDPFAEDDADSEVMTEAGKRPLPPASSDGKKSSNPFISVGKLEPDSQWDESFDEFAAGRLQSPEKLTSEQTMQQSTLGDRPLERCNDTEASWPIDADENTNSNDSIHHQLRTKCSSEPLGVTSQATKTSLRHLDTFPQFLETIPELISFDGDFTLNTSTNSPTLYACTEMKQDSNTTNDLTDTNMNPAPFETSPAQLSNSSPDPTSSGFCSLAEEDGVPCFSSQSDKVSGLFSEEAQSNVLSFENSSESAVLNHEKTSESEDGIADGSDDLSSADVAQETVIQYADGDRGNMISLESGNESKVKEMWGFNFPTVELCKDFSDSSVNTATDVDVPGSPTRELSSTSLYVTTSSPDVKQDFLTTSLETTGLGEQDTKSYLYAPFTFSDDFLNISHITTSPSQDLGIDLLHVPIPERSGSSLLQSLYVSADSQDYQTCDSHSSSKRSSASEPNDTLHSANSTLCGEFSDFHSTAGAVLGLTDSTNTSMSSIKETRQTHTFEDNKEAAVETGLRMGDGFQVLPKLLHDSYPRCNPKSLHEGEVEKQHEVLAEFLPKFMQEQNASLHRSQSEGTLAPAFDEHLLPSFGSDPTSIQESSSAQLGPDFPFLIPFAPESSSSPIPLCTLPPLASVAATFPQDLAPKPRPEDAEQQQQQAALQQNSPHPVKPLTNALLAEEKRSVLATGLEKLKSTIHPGRSSQITEQEVDKRKSLTEGAGSYYHLNHSELVALLVQREAELEKQKAVFEHQKLLLAKRELELKKLKPQVRDLEDYIDTLLVRIMEQKPTLLQVRSKLK